MNGIEIYSSHCKIAEFGKREDDLHNRGYHVVMDYVFDNVKGEKFVKFFYYPLGDMNNVKISPLKKSPSLTKIFKENAFDSSDKWVS